MAQFEIDLEPVGGTIIIDGRDISDQVYSVVVSSEAGRATELHLELRRGSEGKIKGEGVVYVTSAAVEGLEDLDPEEIEAEALSRMDWTSEKSVTEHVLEVIKEKLS